MNRFFYPVILFALTGCASSSGVFKTGTDTYQITATAITSFGGAGTASAKAIKMANEHCAKLGKQAIITSAKTDSQFTQGSSDVSFKCVDVSEAK